MIENEGRIKEDSVEVNYDKIHDFFDGRTKKTLFHKYNLVNYQDNRPEIALERDCIEKDKIFPMLGIKHESKVLDIGCGVGRWGDKIAPLLSREGKYVGVDYSKNLIEVAQNSAKEDGTFDRRKYCIGSFQSLIDVLRDNGINYEFDVVIVNGVLMYLNDKDINNCLSNAVSLLRDKGIFYVKETVGVDYRLTLNNIYSDELTSYYSAIYRSISEYEKIFDQFNSIVISKGETYNEKVYNRKETMSYFWIFENLV